MKHQFPHDFIAKIAEYLQQIGGIKESKAIYWEISKDLSEKDVEDLFFETARNLVSQLELLGRHKEQTNLERKIEGVKLLGLQGFALAMLGLDLIDIYRKKKED